MIIAATGHRPDKLGGYAPGITNRLCLLAHKHIAIACPAYVISGMALGWDQAVAGAALLAQIPLIAAIPFRGQESKWPAASQQIYRELLATSARVIEVCEPGYAVWKMQKRNEWMVDHADHMLALWDGSPGGTGNCIEYANKKQKPIDNLWDEFQFYN
jgi:uncharacterized phage-like protein YoqJ